MPIRPYHEQDIGYNYSVINQMWSNLGRELSGAEREARRRKALAPARAETITDTKPRISNINRPEAQLSDVPCPLRRRLCIIAVTLS